MPIRPYRASGLSNPGGVPLLIAACLGAALAGGVLEGVVSRWLSLVLLFPVLLGGIVSFAAVQVITRTHIRAPWLAAVVSGCFGMVAQLTVEGVGYVQFRSSMSSELTETVPAAAALGDAKGALIDAVLENETGQRGFAGYLLLRAKMGTEVKRAGHSSGGLKLQGTGFWVLFAINLLLAGGIAAGVAWGRAQKPYCEPCQRWYERLDSVGSGSGDKQAVAAAMQALERGAFSEVKTTLGAPQKTGISILQLLRCGGCETHQPQFTCTVVAGNEKKQTTRVAYKSMLLPDEARRLREAFTDEKATTPPAG